MNHRPSPPLLSSLLIFTMVLSACAHPSNASAKNPNTVLATSCSPWPSCNDGGSSTAKGPLINVTFNLTAQGGAFAWEEFIHAGVKKGRSALVITCKRGDLTYTLMQAQQNRTDWQLLPFLEDFGQLYSITAGSVHVDDDGTLLPTNVAAVFEGDTEREGFEYFPELSPSKGIVREDVRNFHWVICREQLDIHVHASYWARSRDDIKVRLVPIQAVALEDWKADVYARYWDIVDPHVTGTLVRNAYLTTNTTGGYLLTHTYVWTTGSPIPNMLLEPVQENVTVEGHQEYSLTFNGSLDGLWPKPSTVPIKPGRLDLVVPKVDCLNCNYEMGVTVLPKNWDDPFPWGP